MAFPLVTGLALGRPSFPGLGLAVAAVAFFLAYEPLAILQGVRGPRLKAQEQDRARTRAAVLLGVGILMGGLGAAGAWGRIWPILLYPAGPLLLLLPLFLLGRHKSLVGELLVVTAFATLVLPLGAASGADRGRLISAAFVWWASFSLGTLEVHAIKARHKNTQRSRWTRWGSPAASAATVCICCALAASGGSPYAWPALALLPPAVGILGLSFIRVHPRHLKRVGWTLVGANTIALILLILASG